MNINLLLKATREIWKQFAWIENMDEDKYREEYKKAINRAFETNEIESEILMYLSEWDGYTRPCDNNDFSLFRYEKENKIKAKVYHPWRYYNTIFEFDANYTLENILESIEQIDRDYK